MTVVMSQGSQGNGAPGGAKDGATSLDGAALLRRTVGRMNKRKKVAWHKHLKKAKKLEEKAKAAGTRR